MPPSFDRIGNPFRGERTIRVYEDALRYMPPITLPDASGSRIEPVVGEVLVLRPQTILLKGEIARLPFIFLDRIEQRRAWYQARRFFLAQEVGEVIFLTALAAEGEREQHAGFGTARAAGKDLSLHRQNAPIGRLDRRMHAAAGSKELMEPKRENRLS